MKNQSGKQMSITQKPVHQPKLRQQQQGTETATKPRDKASQRQTNGNEAKDNAAMLRDKRERKAQEGINEGRLRERKALEANRTTNTKADNNLCWETNGHKGRQGHQEFTGT